MSPIDAYKIDLKILGEIITAKIRYHEEQLDEQMCMLAWQTSLLMTATGNYKKAIKPTDLYTSIADREGAKNKEPKKDIETLRKELIETFSNSIAEG